MEDDIWKNGDDVMAELIGTLWCVGDAACVVINMASVISIVGTLIAIAGASLSVIGNVINTIRFDHWNAIRLWTVSAFLNSLWWLGFILGWWNGVISAIAMLVMNVIFLITNLWGVRNG
jgi:hypothetical protein